MAHVDINVTAGREQVQEPWIWRLSRDFNVRVNLKKANIDGDFGWIQLELEGSIEEIQRLTCRKTSRSSGRRPLLRLLDFPLIFDEVFPMTLTSLDLSLRRLSSPH